MDKGNTKITFDDFIVKSDEIINMTNDIKKLCMDEYIVVLKDISDNYFDHIKNLIIYILNLFI